MIKPIKQVAPPVNMAQPTEQVAPPVNMAQQTEQVAQPVTPPSDGNSFLGGLTQPLDNTGVGGTTQAPESGSVFTHDFKPPVEEEQVTPVAPPSFSSIIDGSQFKA